MRQHIMNANGKPFADKDAAQIKAGLLSKDLGMPFEVVEINQSQYAIKNPLYIPTVSVCKENDVDVCALKETSRDENTTVAQEDNPFDFSASVQKNEEKTETELHQIKKENSAGNEFKSWEEKYPTLTIRPSFYAFVPEFFWAMLALAFVVSPRLLWGVFLTPSDIAQGSDAYQSIPDAISTLFTGIFLYMLLRPLLYWVSHKYKIGNRRVESHYGFIFRKKKSIAVKDIRTNDLDQGIVGRILGFGTIELATAGTSGNDISLKNINNPLKLNQEIERRKEVAERFMINEAEEK